MKKKTGVVMTVAVAALLWGVGIARAQMMGRMTESRRGMMEGRMAGMMGPELAAGCWADLGHLGLSPQVVKSLEDKRFDVQKKTIRTVADIQVLRLELARMLESRTFDLQAAEQKGAEIGQKQAELRAAQLEFLHDLGAALSDEQWQKLVQERKETMSRMGRMGRMAGQRMPPWMTGGMMQGGSGMMMEQGGQEGAGEHGAHHPGASEKAEKFFQEKK
jgi:hypothetical protein